jgi:Protein of unknown function (DUF5672)
MMYPYATFLLDFDRKHPDHTHSNKIDNKFCAFVIETRPNFFLPLVLKNVSYFLGDKWNLYVFCGEQSEPWLRQMTSGWKIVIRALKNQGRLTLSDYSGILMTRKIWESFTEEKILVFQSDIIICNPGIGEFMEYDFIGAPVRYDRNRPDSFVYNGGLSLRSKSKILQCLDTFGPDFTKPEDIYYSEMLRKVNARLPDLETASRFCMESGYSYIGQPFGVHGTDKYYHSPEVAAQIVSRITY